MKNKRKINKLINLVVDQDLCVGCGICTIQCPENALKMKWNDKGFLVPNLEKECLNDCSCITVCPFNPFPDYAIKTENELAQEFLQFAPNYHINIGHYFKIYVGYSRKYRLTSSSGGIATYLLSSLLENKIVDLILTVREGVDRNFHYEYAIIENSDELLSTSRTKYYPVTLAEVMKKVIEMESRMAIVGVACFIKAIRLYQHCNPEMKERIVFLIGIICGGLKSKYFAEYLAEKTGVPHDKFSKPLFRIKDLSSTAADYSFGCNDENDCEHRIKMKQVGDMWGTSMFKNNACEFCDDVATELSDISLGDAWLDPYRIDGRGTSIIVTRSNLAETLIEKGLQSDELNLDSLSVRSFIYTQLGSFYHRYYALGFRIKELSKVGCVVPPKRHSNYRITIDFRRVQTQRMLIRNKSIVLWQELRNAEKFDEAIKREIVELNKRTKTYHFVRKIKKKFFKKWKY